MTLLLQKNKIMGNSCIRILADEKQIKACKRRISEMAEPINNLSGVLSLAGNEVRLKILFLLNEEKELCPCDLSDILGMTIPAVSQHIRKMKDGNIIKARKVGQTIFYSLNPQFNDIMLPLLKSIYVKQKTT